MYKLTKEDLNFCISTVCWLYGKIQFSKGNRYLCPKPPTNAVRTDGGGMRRGLLSAEEEHLTQPCEGGECGRTSALHLLLGLYLLGSSFAHLLYCDYLPT